MLVFSYISFKDRTLGVLGGQVLGIGPTLVEMVDEQALLVWWEVRVIGSFVV
jgi:hypothetical protein